MENKIFSDEDGNLIVMERLHRKVGLSNERRERTLRSSIRHSSIFSFSTKTKVKIAKYHIFTNFVAI